MTETSGEHPAWLSPADSFPNDGAWSLALRIQQALTVGRESAWAYWQMTDGSTVGRFTLTDQSTRQTSPKYVAAKHFFRLIRPNSICVQAAVTGSTTLTASAFLQETNRTLTLVVINSAPSGSDVVINSPATPAEISSWQVFTSSNGNYWQTSAAGITNGHANVHVPGYGVVTLYGIARPLLSAVATGSDQLTLCWPDSQINFVLQSTTNLVPPIVWSTVASAPGRSNGVVRVTLTRGAAGRFYRLAGQ